jgi:hypothetical protein
MQEHYFSFELFQYKKRGQKLAPASIVGFRAFEKISVLFVAPARRA